MFSRLVVVSRSDHAKAPCTFTAQTLSICPHCNRVGVREVVWGWLKSAGDLILQVGWKKPRSREKTRSTRARTASTFSFQSMTGEEFWEFSGSKWSVRPALGFLPAWARTLGQIRHACWHGSGCDRKETTCAARRSDPSAEVSNTIVPRWAPQPEPGLRFSCFPKRDYLSDSWTADTDLSRGRTRHCSSEKSERTVTREKTVEERIERQEMNRKRRQLLW